MNARIRKWLSQLDDAFWTVPAALAALGALLGLILPEIDRDATLSQWLVATSLVYNGGATGARTLLGAIASSAIGVAGTVFSITIAALSLAAGQMGPRLLRNFTRDRGNQLTLGAFIGTFSYALVVLRTVREPSEGEFVPHFSLTFGIVLAFACVGTLIYFVGHMASRINVDTVIDLVSKDVSSAVERLTTESDEHPAAMPPEWDGCATLTDSREGYLQNLDGDALARWAIDRHARMRLRVRPGDYVFPGMIIAEIDKEHEGAEQAIRDATALGAQRVSSEDIEYAVRQLVEVAVRALSPGINDPHTAIGVIDRLGGVLCRLAPRRLHTGVYEVDGKIGLVIPAVDYDGLTDAMFHLIRQNGRNSPAILIRMIDALTTVAECERDPGRLVTVERHVHLIGDDARRETANASDLANIEKRIDAFAIALRKAAWPAAV